MLLKTFLWTICTLLNTVAAVEEHTNADAVGFSKKARVLGGTPVDITAYPFMVSVRHSNRHSCGGTLYTTSWIMTAASCLVQKSSNYLGHNFSIRPVDTMSAWMGARDVSKKILPENAQSRDAAAIFPHPDYKEWHKYPDIGLMSLTEPFILTERVQLTKLPSPSMANTLPEQMKNCHVAGWGFTSKHDSARVFVPGDESLMMANLVMISEEQCDDMFRVFKCEICSGIDESGGNDACKGDTGGPLVCDGKQVGIFSWGPGCGWEHMATLFTRVDCFVDWMRKVEQGAENQETDDENEPDKDQPDKKEKKPTGKMKWWVMLVVVVIVGVMLTVVLGCIIYKAIVGYPK